MANEIEQDNFSFGIQDTVQIGAGNSNLLNDLLGGDGGEDVTTDPDKIQDINTPDGKPKPSDKPAAKKEEEEEADDSLDSFLSNNDDEDDDDDDVIEGVKQNAGKPKKAGVEKQKKKEDDDDDNDDDKVPGTQFGALANDLIELGVFSPSAEGDEPITTPEAFLAKFNTEKEEGARAMVDNFLGQFGDDYKNAFDAIFVNGADPKQYFQSSVKLRDFSNMDLTNEANQEKVVRRALADQGFEEEDIEDEVERLKNYGDLDTVSQRHHKVLIKKQAAALEEETKATQSKQAQKLQLKQTYYTNVNKLLQDKVKEKEFDGLPLNPKIATELQDFLLVDKWKTDSGDTLTDFDKYILDLKRPENHATKVKVGLLLKLLEKDPTLSTIQKSGASKKSNELFKEVSRQVANTPKKTTGKSWFQN